MPPYPGFRYEASGLNYVYLTEIEPSGDGETTLPGINVLHDLIAEALIRAPGSLDAQEVKYLRAHLGLELGELAIPLKMKSAQVRDVEDGRRCLNAPQNMSLRYLVFSRLRITPPPQRSLFMLCGAFQLEGRRIRIAGTDGRSYRILPQDAL